MTHSGYIVTLQQLLLMVTSSLHALVWEENGEELLILTSVQEMIVRVSGGRPHILMLASVEWPVFFCQFFYLWNKLPEVVGELEDTRREILLTFYRIHPSYSRKIDEGYVSGLSIIYSSNPHQHIWTLTTYILVMMKQQTNNSIVLALYTTAAYSPPSYCMLAVIIIVNQLLGKLIIMTYTFLMTHYEMEQDVYIIVAMTLDNLGSIVS